MVDEKLDTGLPAPNLSVLNQKKLRNLGTFEEELSSMIQRMEKLKPFPKGELIIEAMGATRSNCPFDAETWSCNMGYFQIMQLDGHFSKVFITHTQVKDIYGNPAFCWEHYNKMVKAGIDVYNIHKIKGLNSKLYPLKRIMKKFKTDFFSNTISYMVALALDMGYKKIRLYGCDMMTREEYAWEKGGIEFWLGVAKGMGVDVEITDGSSLLKTITGKPYGIKYFKLKDIDPSGIMRRQLKKLRLKTPLGSTGFFMENPIKPPMPEMTPYVTIQGIPTITIKSES